MDSDAVNPQTPPLLTAMDLFCGCGGLTLGLKQAGFRVIGAVDIERLAVDSYRSNHPEVFVWTSDIRALKGRHIKKALGLRNGALDLLAGCPPCQGFSSVRTWNGGRQINDPQNDLVFEFLRVAKELRPKAIMMENVPGLATDRRIEIVRNQLQELGYECQIRILDAADYGVPQRRRRMILLAGRYGTIEIAEADHHRRTVRHAIEGRLPPPGKSGDPLHDLPEHRALHITELIRKIPKDGGSRLDLGWKYQLPCHKRCNGFKDIYGRMSWDDVAPTITGGCASPSKGRFLHPEENRAITLREAALLQGFPPSYHFSLARGKMSAAVMIGNALPPEFIRRQALQINTYINDAQSR